MIKKIVLLMLIVVCFFVVISAEDETKDEVKGDTKTVEKKLSAQPVEEKTKDRVIGAPILYYTPETRLAYGAAGSYIFRMSGGKSARPSSISPILVYTQEKQFKAQVNADMYLKPDDYRLQAEV
ncbi:MAG: BamA/TamA family outer membrane protein, partial [Acidobacteriota bacterium]|nr:BamA/TamA family outer membrane protein [Acidobacteriota bacterium]